MLVNLSVGVHTHEPEQALVSPLKRMLVDSTEGLSTRASMYRSTPASAYSSTRANACSSTRVGDYQPYTSKLMLVKLSKRALVSPSMHVCPGECAHVNPNER